MVRLNIVIDLEGVNEAATKNEKGEVMTNNVMFVNITRNFIANYAHQNRGLTYEEQRIYGKLMSLLKEIEKKNDILKLEIDDEWHEFLKKVIQVKMMPGALITKYYDLVENPLPKA